MNIVTYIDKKKLMEREPFQRRDYKGLGNMRDKYNIRIWTFIEDHDYRHYFWFSLDGVCCSSMSVTYSSTIIRFYMRVGIDFCIQNTKSVAAQRAG